MDNNVWGENFCGFKEVCVIFVRSVVWRESWGAWSERAEELGKTRQKMGFLGASRDQEVSEALLPWNSASSQVILHTKAQSTVLKQDRTGIWPVYQKMSWLLSLSTGLALLLSHHSPSLPAKTWSSRVWPKPPELGPHQWASSLGSLRLVLLTRESQHTLNCMWPHRKGRLQERHLNIKRKKVEKSKLTCLGKIRLTNRFLELPVILFSIKF